MKRSASPDNVGPCLRLEGESANAQPVVERPPVTETRSAVVSALHGFGAEAVAPLMDALDDERDAIRQHALCALTVIGEPALRPLLFRFLRMHSGWENKESFPLSSEEIAIAVIARSCREQGKPGVVPRFREYREAVPPIILKGIAVLAGEVPEWEAFRTTEGARTETVVAPPSTTASMSNRSFACSQCGRSLDEIGIPPQVQVLQQYAQVLDVGSSPVSDEIKADPFLFRGFYCSACNEVFCPRCSNNQGERCVACGKPLMPAYRPLLKNLEAETEKAAGVVIAAP